MSYPLGWTDLPAATPEIVLAVSELAIPVLLLDPDGDAVAVNRAWSAVTGLSSSASRGRRWLSAVAGASRSMVAQVISTRRPPPLFVGLQRRSGLDRRGGPYLSGLLSSRPIEGPGSEIIGHIVFFNGMAGLDGAPAESAGDDDERLAIEAARAELRARVDRALERHRGQPTTVAAVLVAIDRVVSEPEEVLEPLHDTRPLAVVGPRIADALSNHDSMVPVGRGFAVICEQIKSYEEVAGLAQRLIDAIDVPVQLEGDRWPLRASVGVAFPHLPVDTAEALVAKAERATELARTLGGHRYEVVIGTGPGSSDLADSQVVAGEPAEAQAEAAAASAGGRLSGSARPADRR